MDRFEELVRIIGKFPVPNIEGQIVSHRGLMLKAKLVGVSVGDYVKVSAGECADCATWAKVVAFDGNNIVISPFSTHVPVALGASVKKVKDHMKIIIGPKMIGSIVDCTGKMIYVGQRSSNKLSTFHPQETDLSSTPPNLLCRKIIDEKLEIGIRAIDGLLTIGKGQRLGIFAEPGVGKTTLIASIANNAKVDVNVIGLIGERGREVVELYKSGLSEETRQKTIIVASTSDEPAIARMTAAFTATRIAECLRDQGFHVLLQIDSLTRLFRAYREVGVAAGEIPIRRGYPASVFTDLPNLLERAGKTDKGSITAFYTVLLSSDIDEDPMVDEVKGLTDGHIILKRNLAEVGHYPAIDVLQSLSRLSSSLQGVQHLKQSRRVLRLLARLQEGEESIKFGGNIDDELKEALERKAQIITFLRQNPDQCSSWDATMSELIKV